MPGPWPTKCKDRGGSAQVQGEAHGTLIQVENPPSRVTAIVADTQLERFIADKEQHLFTQLEAAEVPIRSVVDDEVVVDLRNWHDREQFTLPPGAVSQGVLTEVTAVGIGIGSELSLFQKATAVDAAGVQWHLKKSTNMHALVGPPEDITHAQQSLHAVLLEPQT